MVSSIVKDVFSTKFKSVSKDDLLSACLSILNEESTPVLVVLDSKGKYAGVIAHRWIVRSRYNPATTKVESLMRSAPSVSPEDSLSKVARLMITSGISQLPVFSGEKLVGIVTDDAIIQGAVVGKWGNTKVEEVMTKKPFLIEEDESVGAVLSLFREHDISHVPVVKDGTLVGIVSIKRHNHRHLSTKTSPKSRRYSRRESSSSKHFSKGNNDKASHHSFARKHIKRCSKEHAKIQHFFFGYCQ